MHFDLSSLQSYLSPLLWEEIAVFGQVALIDIVMAGDNALAVGIAAAELSPRRRTTAIVFGLLLAVIARIALVFILLQMLKVEGLRLAGGLLLMVVCFRLLRQLRRRESLSGVAARSVRGALGPKVMNASSAITLSSAILSILIADISMSLDNVLAITGAAQGHMAALAFGLIFSIAAMGVAANFVAKLLHRFRWIAYIGVLIVFVVALRMIIEGGLQIWCVLHCDLTFKCLPDVWHQTYAYWSDLLRKL